MPPRKTYCKKYGELFSTVDPILIELEAISRNGNWINLEGGDCGKGLAFHVKALSQLVWPWVEWHRWNNDLILPELCKVPHTRVALFGPASACKTFTAALFVNIMYAARPDNTTVLCSTTTREKLDLGIWADIKKIWREAKKKIPWWPGFLIDSKQQITTDGKGTEGREFRNGMVGRPTKRGGEWVGLGDYQGLKNDYMYLIADEAALMPDGFWKSCANLMSNENFTVCAIGNLNDLSTPLGEAAEPENGWDSIPDTTKSRVYTTRWYGGSAIQLVGEDSPNLEYPEGKEPFKKLIGRRFLKQCEQDYGKDTPLYNMFAGGKIPRGTLENRIITRQLCLQFHVFEPVIWGHQPLTKLYGADISYSAEHGDRTVGIPFAFGIDNEGKKRIAPIERPKVYGGDKPKWEKSDIPFEEQLAIDMKAECERLGIPPANVFFDGTGRSSFTSALMRTWSTAVNAVEFGGTATERPNFMNRRYREGRYRGELLQCRELFGKFVTELWFAGRHAIEFDQVRGMSEEVMKEAYFRLWFLTPSNKIDAEPKKEMKLRLGRSPDLADAWVAGLEGARRLGFTIGSHETIRPRNTKWLRDLRDQHEKELKSQELVYEG